MAELVFEIWRDEDDNSFEMSPVSERGDCLRKSISPNAVRVYTFTACSDFEAAQKNYEWHDWGTRKSPEGLDELFFSEEEAEEQRRYIATQRGS